jgi:hypothetical protein
MRSDHQRILGGLISGGRDEDLEVKHTRNYILALNILGVDTRGR